MAIARTGSLVRAAVELGRTQPSLSARLSALERAWETRLFRRGARGMTLTPEGARLLPLAEAALRSLEALDVAAGVPVSGPGEIRVAAGDALGREVLPKALARLLEREPTVGVRLLEGPTPRLLQALREGEIDVALVVRGHGATTLPGLDVEPLVESPVELILPPGRRVSRGAMNLGALASERWVTLQPGSEFRRHVERAFESKGLSFIPSVEVGNLSLVRRFVAAGVAPVVYVRAFRSGAPLGPSVVAFLRALERAVRG